MAPPTDGAGRIAAGIRDVLGRKDDFIEKSVVHREMRQLLGGNLFDLTHDDWLPRRRALQPVFTKQHVSQFGGDMAQAAELIVGGWVEGAEVDLDAECRRRTLRALGRSVLGLDLDERADALGEPVRVALNYIADRALQPVRAPRWLPTPARQRAAQPAMSSIDLPRRSYKPAAPILTTMHRWSMR